MFRHYYYVSEWAPVLSGVPQGSVLGPLLFVVFINDLPEVLSPATFIKLYADDSKLTRIIRSAIDREVLQRNLDAVVTWTRTWLMELNVKKCKLMHFSVSADKDAFDYSMDQRGIRTLLERSNCERDLGILIDTNLNFNEQVERAASEAQRQLGMLRRCFVSRDCDLWRRLYITYVRPLLEFAVQAWCPRSRDGCNSSALIDRLERVQQRATSIPHVNRGLSYEDRCAKWGLTSLRARRIRGDLIEMYKIHHGLDVVNWHHPPRTGVHSRLQPELVKHCAARSNFFHGRVAQLWNRLPDFIVSAASVNQFKERLEEVGCLLTFEA